MKRLPFAALAVFALSGCATQGQMSANDKLALYNAHAGAPVSSFRYLGSINGWTPLGDSAVALWTGPSKAWLLDLYGPCNDLQSTPVIGVTSMMGQVSAKFDKVLVRGTGAFNLPCRISQIRPLDVKAIKQAEKNARETLQGTRDQPAEPSEAPGADSGT